MVMHKINQCLKSGKFQKKFRNSASVETLLDMETLGIFHNHRFL